MDRVTKRQLKAEDLYRLEGILSSNISPCGSYLVYSKEYVEEGGEGKFADLFLINIENRTERQLTFDKWRDIEPLWSPDGRHILFLSNKGDLRQYQFYTLSLDNGESQRLTHLKGDIQQPTWSADGCSIIFGFRKRNWEKESPKDIVCRRITRVFFKSDGIGFLPEDRWHLHVLELGSLNIRQITGTSQYDDLEPLCAPDGKFVYYLSNRSPDPDLAPFDMQLFRVPLTGGREENVGARKGPKQYLSMSPNGRYISYVGYTGSGNWWKLRRLVVLPVDNPAAETHLTRDDDYSVGADTLNDLGGIQMTAPVWGNDSRSIYYQVSLHGRTILKNIHIDSREAIDIVHGDGTVGYFSIDQAEERLVYFYVSTYDPGQIRLLNLNNNQTRTLTDVNRELLKEVVFGRVEEVWFDSIEGRRVQGWIAYPPNFDIKRTYPSIMVMHGGPKCQYGYSFMHEFHYLAGLGYVVYYCNPAGSLGYGENFSRALTGHYGSADYQDVMAWADYMEALPFIDSDRMGLTGGSVGGLMTNWIIGHTHRFSAAVAQRCCSNIFSQWGSGDMNWFHQYEFGERPPWENFKQYWDQSPVKYVGNVTTPTLFIHSDNDLRCGTEQVEQMFIALKYLGVETEMIRFPEEGHELSRSGRTDRRIARLKHITRWFDTYLHTSDHVPH